MKPLLARSNSSPQTSSNFLKRTYRPSPISPYHLIHYQETAEFGAGAAAGPNNVGGTGTSLVGGWLSRRGSVPDHKQVSHDAGRSGAIGNQSRSPGNSRKGSVAQQEDCVGKQRSGVAGGQEGRKATITITTTTTTTAANANANANANATVTKSKAPLPQKPAREIRAME